MGTAPGGGDDYSSLPVSQTGFLQQRTVKEIDHCFNRASAGLFYALTAEIYHRHRDKI